MSKLKYFLIAGFLRIAGLLPLAWAQRLGRLGGALAWALNTDARKVTETNIALCLPELSPHEQKQLARSSLKHTGMTALEIPLMWEWPVEKCLKLVKETDGLELVDEALASGKGMVLLAPHLGNWELVGLYFSSHYKMAALYSPPRIKEFEDYMIQVRGRLGSELVRGDRRGLLRLMTLLKEGGIAGILPDQSPSRDKSSVYAPFFGVHTLTMTLLNKLVQKTDAQVLVAYAERLAPGEGFRMVIRKPEAGIGNRDAQSGATAMNQSVENIVRLSPEQYQWEYKRFRHRLNQSTPYS